MSPITSFCYEDRMKDMLIKFFLYIINFTLLKTIKSYNLRMKIKQLVLFTILNYLSIRKYLHNFKKTELYDQ